MKKQSTNHARAKRRIKVLKLKNFCKRVMEKRAIKIEKMRKPKGKTIVGQARLQAYYPGAEFSVFITNKSRRLNQRQQRKQWRQAPQSRRKIV